jgi:predicted phage terminase large subunit-like protein
MDSTSLLNLFEDLRSRDDQETAKLLWKFRLATDLRIFASAYFPHYCKFEFNEFHSDLFKNSSFMERSIRSARAAPRGYAKSTLEALIEPIHDVCYGLEKFIVIFSNTEEQSNQKLADIRAEVFTNDNLVRDYGIHFKTKKPGAGQYTLYCGDHSCLFQSHGANTEVRGIRFGADRPSKIVVDDGEHSEEVLNEAIRGKYRDWMFQVVSKLGDTFTNIKVIGTILHRESLLADLIKNPSYDGKIYKAVISWANNQKLWNEWTAIYTNIDNANRKSDSDSFYAANKDAMDDGVKVLWPEKESYLYLMKELIETGKRAFWKEKQNEPIGGDEALFENLYFYKEVSEGFLIEHNQKLIPWSQLKDKEGRWLSAFGVLDPAAGQTKPRAGKLSDYACLLTGIKDGRERLFVHADSTKRISPTKQIEQIFELNEIFGYQKFGVETNLFRNLMMPNIEAERKRVEQRLSKACRVPFYDIDSSENKIERINTLEPKVTHKWILFNRELSHTFISQMQEFPHGDHDDCPDALHMLFGLVNNRYKASSMNFGNQGAR